MTFRMKPMYQVLLCGTDELRIGLYHLYKATPEQLCRLHYSPGSLKAVKARLKELRSHGYVVVNSVAVKHQTPRRMFYSARHFYTLAPPGVRYLADLGYDVSEYWKPHNEADRHALFADHTLELNDVIIAAALLRTSDPRFYLESFRHELILKRHPYPVTLPDGHASKVIPDAQLDFRRVGSNDHFLVLLEHDRGTEERAVFMRKIQSYVAFVKAGGHVDAFELPAEGDTVRELLEDLMGRFPALRSQLVEDDDIAPFVNVYVEGEDVRTLDGLETAVAHGSTVILLPAMAGGGA
jgi:molybdopterin synthase sulfur carrier subunit